MTDYPKVLDEKMVEKYSALAKAGGGYVWDEVLEYRVWCHPENGAGDLEEGNDYYYAFTNLKEAKEFSKNNKGTEEPLAVILQKEYINEPENGKYVHVKEERIYNLDKSRYINDPKLFKKLDDEIWEFRTRFNKKQYRLFAFWDKREEEETLVVSTHGIVKKTSKIPKKEIAKADKIREQYFNDDNN